MDIGSAVRRTHGAVLPILRIGIVESLVRHLGVLVARSMARIATDGLIRAGSALTQGDGLLRRELDLIFSPDPLEEIEGLQRFTLIREPYVLVVPRSLRGEANSLAGLAARTPFIRYPVRSHTGLDIERHLRRIGVQVERRLEVSDTSLILSMVAQNVGWMISTPLSLLGLVSSNNHIEILKLPGPGLSRRLMLIARSSELGSIPAELADHCREVLDQDVVPRALTLVPSAANEMRVTTN